MVKTRRGRRKKQKYVNSNDKWSIYQSNIRNLDSKQTSLESIVSSNMFSLVVLNETHLQKGRKVTIPGYVSYTRNRIDKASGGISTSVIDNDSSTCVRVEEGNGDNEFIVTRHSQFKVPINVVNIYGQQECRMSKDNVERHWNEILEVISRIEGRIFSASWGFQPSLGKCNSRKFTKSKCWRRTHQRISPVWEIRPCQQ